MTTGVPFVTVPVLSKAMISTLPASSKEDAVLKRMPFFAPTPFPTIIATGVARPSAQGQLMTRTATPRESATENSAPLPSTTRKVRSAIPMTKGTKTAEILSAMRAIGAFVAAASDTISIICERLVSFPIRTAFAVIYPDRFRVPAEILSPSSLSAGIDSPVSADSSIAVRPERISPSTGICSPGFTAKTSPTATSSTDTVFSTPSFKSTAVLGLRFINPFRALVVLPFEIDSNIFPRVIRVGIIAAVSK